MRQLSSLPTRAAEPQYFNWECGDGMLAASADSGEGSPPHAKFKKKAAMPGTAPLLNTAYGQSPLRGLSGVANQILRQLKHNSAY